MVTLTEGKWSCYRGRENGYITELASLMEGEWSFYEVDSFMEGEWSCYRGGQFKRGRMVMLHFNGR